MKKLILLMLILSVSPAFGVDDDSTPYMPYTEPQAQPQTKQAPAKKSAPKKKASSTKKTAPKKTAAKKTASTRKKAAPARSSNLQKGIALMQQERYEQAKPYLLRAIQENRNDPNAWYWWGVYQEKMGGFHQAQYFYSKAVTIDPTFEPLSRVVFYPEDPEKTPLWDPKRPARVYPVEVASTGGLTTVPAGRSSFPTAPNDPELPHVPVYTPPEPGSSPLDGDSWSPAVYVPPGPDEVQTEGEQTPVYVPPEPVGVVAQAQTRQTLEVPVSGYYEGYEVEEPGSWRDDILRADKPLYNPPNPGEKAPTPPRQTQQVSTAKQTTAKQVSTPRKASVPDSRIVRQTQKPKKTSSSVAKKTPARTQQSSRRRQAVSQDVRPQTQPQPQPPSRRTPEPVTLPPEPETRQERQSAPQYYPPVGQQAPDPGTIPDNGPLPPVGQGQNQ